MRLAPIVVVVLAIAAAPPCALAQNDAGEGQVLSAGSSFESGLQRGDRHTYRIPLDVGQFFHVTIEQRALDVGVRLLGADGSVLQSADTLNGAFGIERIAFLAPVAAEYVVEVTTGAAASPGRYELKVLALRMPTVDDQRHASAERAFAAAEALRRQNTGEARAAAIVKYREAASSFQALRLNYEAAITLYSIGFLQLSGGQARGAAVDLAAALPFAQSLNDPLVPSIVNALGGAYDILGDLDRSMANYREALAAFRTRGNRNGEANALNNIGKIYGDLADWQRAIEQYRQALPIWKAVNDVRREGITLHNIGVTFSNAGDPDRAVEYFTEALERRRAAKDQAGEADTLSALGLAESRRGDHRKALAHYEAALPLRLSVGDKRSEALTRDYIGRTYLELRETANAARCFEQSLALYKNSSDKRGEALALGNMAGVHAAEKRYAEAVDHASRALQVLHEIGDRSNEAGLLYLLARVERDRGNRSAARAHVEDALRTIEEVRGRVASRQLRTAYFSNQHEVAMFHVDLLMRQHEQDPSQGHDVRALEANERARARSLIDLLVENGERSPRHGADSAILARERQVAATLSGKAARLVALRARGTPSADSDALAKEVRSLEAEYDEIQAALRKANPAYVALTRPQSLDLRAIQRDLLDSRTMILEYALGDDASYVWAVNQQPIRSFRLPRRAVIEDLTREVYGLVTARGAAIADESEAARRNRLDAADRALPDVLRRLSTMVLAPVLPIAADSRILIVADGALEYIPFAMLTVSEAGAGRSAQPLITRAEIVSLPSASTLAVHRAMLAGRSPATKTLAMIADPVFDTSDPRVSTGATVDAAATSGVVPSIDRSRLLEHLAPAASGGRRQVIPRLPATATEAAAVARVAGGAGLSAIGFDATKAAVLGDRLKDFRYVHFATHGIVDSDNPSLSAIVLSLIDQKGEAQDGFLRADELYDLQLSADLVVLSACQTGLGRQIRGEGLVGLTRGFMYAGASKVAVSLWSVSDNATSELMVRLYKQIMSAGLTPAAALRSAQMSLMKSGPWRHPYYWSAFTIQGDWK